MSGRGRAKLLSARDSLEAELIASGGEGVLITEARRTVLTQQPLQLLQKLKEGTFSAVAVLEAFQAKAIEESKRTNCVTAFIPDALQWARELDSTRSSLALETKPLFGLPLSVKDMIGVKGLDSTLGLEKRVDVPVPEDAEFVKAFKLLGAVPFVMTNNPQTCMSFNCSNPVFGESLNPVDISRATGGSSGGEGALIGGGGSFLGLGSDIAGSLRVPSHFCGIATVKPTARRTTGKGIIAPFPPIPGVPGTIGIMGIDALIVAEATRAFFSLDQSEFDINCPPLEWRQHLFQGTVDRPLKQKLRIGWYTDLGIFNPTPGVKRSVLESVKVLENLGHELVPFQPPDVHKAIEIYYDLLFADSGVNAKKLLEGETLDPSAQFYYQLASVPAQLRESAKPFLKERFGDFAADLPSRIKTPADLWDKHLEALIYVQQFTGLWRAHNLDLVVCPVWPVPALKKSFDSSMFAISVYTLLYNLLDFPAAVVPVTKETKEDQKLLESYSAGDCRLQQLMKEHTKGSEGLPLGVQFVALPFCEEILCRIMIEFSKAVDYNP